MPASVHVPVLSAEIIEWLAPSTGERLIDGTLGGGGHTRLLAEQVGAEGVVLACDRDPTAIERAAEQLAGMPVQLLQANFADLPGWLDDLGWPPADGILLDLGLSSDQLDASDRGFSYDAEGPLDLRFDPHEGEPAWRLLGRWTERQLADVIFAYGEERYSRRIARHIVARRRERPIRTAAELAALVRRVVPRGRGHQIDPATRTFQALRIAVNDELGALERALRDFPSRLRVGGRLAVISFHSLEDRLVKHAFREDPRWHALTRKPVRPSEGEQQDNPRSRSARLRVAERVEGDAAG